MANLLKRVFNSESKNYKYKLEREKDKILEYLRELEKLEAKLWGTDIKTLKGGEEQVLEDTNHLIYMISRKDYSSLKKVLELKDVKSFLSDLDEFRKDFKYFKKELREKERLKLLISNFTIKLVDANNYNKFRDVFLIEKKLYEVLDRQDEELSVLFEDISKIRVNTLDEKIDLFLGSLKKIREILGGHLDNYKYFEEDRAGYSNASNLIFELINIFNQDID
jgi:hypothetical protein